MGALDRAERTIEFIQARHEELAAFMACAHAKFTGEIGVCLATSGPGAIHLLNGLYDAKMDHQPVLAIVGQQERAAIGGDYQQEVDLLSLFKDVPPSTCTWRPRRRRCATSSIARCASRIEQRTRDLHHRSRTTCRSMEAVETPPRKHGTVHTGIGCAAPQHRAAARASCSARPRS